MSKKFVAACLQQGTSVPTTLPKHPILVNEIRNLLENVATSPLKSATDTLGQVEALFLTISELAGPQGDLCTLARIQTLCEVGAHIAQSQGNYVDCARESLAIEHIPSILAALGGES